MKNIPLLRMISLILVLVGGINWGLIGLFNFNLVGTLFGAGLLAHLVYILVGVGAGFLVYLIVTKQEKL